MLAGIAARVWNRWQCIHCLIVEVTGKVDAGSNGISCESRQTWGQDRNIENISNDNRLITMTFKDNNSTEQSTQWIQMAITGKYFISSNNSEQRTQWTNIVQELSGVRTRVRYYPATDFTKNTWSQLCWGGRTYLITDDMRKNEFLPLDNSGSQFNARL